MFEKKTAIILGAGASWHYGYPTGVELINLIIKRFETQIEPQGILFGGEYSSCSNFVQKLKTYKPISIDKFVNHFSDYEDAAKLLISEAILSFEAVHNTTNIYKDNFKSMAYFNEIESKHKWLQHPMDWKEEKLDQAGHWYRFLFDAIVSGVKTYEDLELNLSQLKIITFNYDNSLDYYLYECLRNFPLVQDKAVEKKQNPDDFVISLLRGEDGLIEHVYGSVGSDKTSISYYGNYTNLDVTGRLARAKIIMQELNLIRYGDVIEDSYARKLSLVNYQRKYILGFGFDEFNCNLIGLRRSSEPDNKVFVTNFGDSKKTERQISKYCGSVQRGQAEASAKNVYDALNQDFSF